MIFNKIAVIPNEKKDPLLKNTKNVINYFIERNARNTQKSNKSNKSDKCVIYADKSYEEKIGINDFNFRESVNYVPEDDLYKICNLLIVLGGDGTILKVASKASVCDIPIIGINLGRIGFMSGIEADETDLFENLFSGNYKTEKRMMIDVEIIKAGGDNNINNIIEYAGSALNDAVITNGGATPKLIELDLMCDNIKITHYRADGVIIATPTGSTAYSMSAGGPVIDPNTECFCVTPVCPHSFINRPIIFSHGSVLEMKNKNADNANYDIYLTIDGQTNIKLGENDTVRIKKSGFTTKLIAIKKHGFFDVIRKKISEN